MSRIQDNRFESSLGLAIIRLFRLQNRRYGRIAESFAISAEQGHLLLLLWTRGGSVPMGELGELAALSSGTLSAAIDRMEKVGLATRRPDPDDRRGVLVEAPRWPAARRERLFRSTLELEDELLEPLSPTERKQLVSLLQRVLVPIKNADR